MSRRLTAVMIGLLSIILLSLGIPLARGLAQGDTERVYSDRLADAARFASEAGEAVSPVDRTVLSAELARYEQVFGVGVLVLDVHGQRLLASGPDPAPIPAADQTVVDALLAGRQPAPPAAWLPWDPVPLVTGAPMLRNGSVIGAVVLLSPTAVVRHRIRSAWLSLIGLAVVALITAAFASRCVTRWILRPVGDLTRTTARINAGDLHARSEVDQGPPELRGLAESFNQMVRYVQEVIETQRLFVADASHQLRTPLSALILRIEDLTDARAKDQGTSAELALEAGRSLATTLDTMLALARVEEDAPRSAVTELCRAIDERLVSWRFVAEHRGITIARTGAQCLQARHDPGSLCEAFDAVIDNAIKYSGEGSVIEVSASGEGGPAGETPMVVLSVIDQGPGLEAVELARVTDRFWRSRRDGNVPGSGLGMSIAGRLLERQGGQLQVSANPGGGLRVDLILAGPEEPSQGLRLRR